MVIAMVEWALKSQLQQANVNWQNCSRRTCLWFPLQSKDAVDTCKAIRTSCTFFAKTLKNFFGSAYYAEEILLEEKFLCEKCRAMHLVGMTLAESLDKNLEKYQLLQSFFKVWIE